MDYYTRQIVSFIVEVGKVSTNRTLYLNGEQKSANDKLTVEFYDKVNISLQYLDGDNNHIPDATVYLTGGGLEQDINLTENATKGIYYLLLDNGTEFGLTIDSYSIWAETDYYERQITPFIVEVEKEFSKWELFMDGINKTSDQAIELPIGSVLNISVKYIDECEVPIDGSEVNLTGEGLNDLSLVYNESIDMNNVFINTSEQLKVGVNLLTIIAREPYYQTQSIDLRITIRKISIQITENAQPSSSIEIRPGQSFNIRIALNNTDFGGQLTNANVTYSWQYGRGELSGPDENGYFTGSFGDLPEGAYTITIFASAGENYDIESFKITVSVVRPASEYQFLQTVVVGLAIGAVAIAAGFGGYFALYHFIFKYPRQIRTLHKFKRSLGKKKFPDISVKDRRTSFRERLSEEIGKAAEEIETQEFK